jgi:hypothetical protein
VAERTNLTLVYGARNTQENEAVVLRDYLIRERLRPAAGWDFQALLLAVIAAVVAADRDAVASASRVERFASPLMTAAELTGALEALLARNLLLPVPGGWKLTPRAQRQVHQLARRRALDAVSA